MCKVCKASWKSTTGWNCMLGVSCSAICCQLELSCCVSVLKWGNSGSHGGIEKQPCSKVPQYWRGKHIFNRGQSSNNGAEEALGVLSLPGCVFAEAGEIGDWALLSAVCQLAVNIYCFSCCKASSQHVREKCFNVLKAQSTQQWSFFKEELRFLAGARMLFSKFLKAGYKLCQFAVVCFLFI